MAALYASSIAVNGFRVAARPVITNHGIMVSGSVAAAGVQAAAVAAAAAPTAHATAVTAHPQVLITNAAMRSRLLWRHMHFKKWV
jgi:hypothetical protein